MINTFVQFKIKARNHSNRLLANLKARLLDGQAKASHGYLYVVSGENYYKEACLSLRSLRRYTHLPVHIITNIEQEKCIADGFSSATTITDSHPRSKVDYICMTPYENTIYLDSDIIVKMAIDEIFEIVDRYDIVAAIDVSRKKWSTGQLIDEYSNIPYCFPEVNSGLLGFNSKRAKETLAAWREIYYSYKTETDSQDQPSLRMALWRSRAFLYLLPPEFNVRSRNLIERINGERNEFGSDHMKPRVHHLHYSLEVHRGVYSVTSLEELEELTDPKVYSITY